MSVSLTKATTKLDLKVAGKTTHLLHTKVKDKDRYYWVLDGKPQAARFGIKVPALADALPTEVEINGTVIQLKAGLSGKAEPQMATHSAPLTVDGEAKAAKVVINDHGDGTWQVIAAVFGAGGGAVNSAPRADLFG